MESTNMLMEQFRAALLEDEKSESTVKKYMHDVELFCRWLSKCEPEKLKVLEYKQYLMARYAPRSVNSHISSLNVFFEFLNRPDLKIKTVKIQREIFAETERELSMKEYERLLDAAKEKNDKLYCLILTIASTGIRISELSYVTVEAVNNGFAVIRCKGKVRKVLLPTSLCRILKGYINKKNIRQGAVFITRNGNTVDRSNVWKMLKVLSHDANVDTKKIYPHNFRHLFARVYYSMQKDIVRLADILGHSSVNTTRIYTMETGNVHLKQIEKMGMVPEYEKTT